MFKTTLFFPTFFFYYYFFLNSLPSLVGITFFARSTLVRPKKELQTEAMNRCPLWDPAVSWKGLLLSAAQHHSMLSSLRITPTDVLIEQFVWTLPTWRSFRLGLLSWYRPTMSKTNGADFCLKQMRELLYKWCECMDGEGSSLWQGKYSK